MQQTFPDALVVDLLQPGVARQLAARPERLRDLLAGSPAASTIVLDEIQKVPELLNVVHATIESPDRRRFVLTGSSARKLRRGGVNLYRGTVRERQGRTWIVRVDEFLRSLIPARLPLTPV